MEGNNPSSFLLKKNKIKHYFDLNFTPCTKSVLTTFINAISLLARMCIFQVLTTEKMSPIHEPAAAMDARRMIAFDVGFNSVLIFF